MMPLCTTDTPPETCGWAFLSEGTPWVAQRVCAMPISPAKPPARRSSSVTRPAERRRSSVPRAPLSPPWTTATPAESYPRYSRRFRPSISTGTTLRADTAPTIPHMAAASLGRLRRALPPRNGRLAHARDGQLAGGSVLGQGRAGAERRTAPDAHRRDELRVGADEDVVLDDRPVLVRAVVVAGNGVGADVHVLSHLAVTDVGQVIGLRAGVDAARLDLDEVADVHVLREQSPGTDARVRAEAAVRSDLRLVDVAEGLDAGPGANLDVSQHAMRTDADAVAQLDGALEDAIDVD